MPLMEDNIMAHQTRTQEFSLGGGGGFKPYHVHIHVNVYGSNVVELS